MEPHRQRLASDRMVIESPMSFTGSARRLWRMTDTPNAAARVALVVLALVLVLLAWSLIACWYMLFGLLVVPWRVLRRGSRKRKREQQRHRETIAAMRAHGR